MAERTVTVELTLPEAEALRCDAVDSSPPAHALAGDPARVTAIAKLEAVIPWRNGGDGYGVVERTSSRLMFRWRVAYYGGGGMTTETLHFTRLGARLSRWLWS